MRLHSFPTRDFLKGSRTVPEICSRFPFLLFSSLSIFIQHLVSFLRPSRKTKKGRSRDAFVEFHIRRAANRIVQMKIAIRSIKLALISCRSCRRFATTEGVSVF